MSKLFEPVTFKHGPAMPNRFMLAPLTNQQSHDKGILSEEEIHWLAMRAKGGFGMVMTAAAFVQPEGQGFPGQIGIQDDSTLDGLKRLADKLNAEGTHSQIQLYHAGLRAHQPSTGTGLVAPSDDAETGARGLSTAEVEAMIEAFIVGAERTERAGFHGAEIHGAHTYLICEFLSEEYNRRTDRYGGSLENRARALREIIAGIRARTSKDFNLGLRLSGERMGMKLGEVLTLSQQLFDEGALDYLDMSLWDVFKEPEEEAFKGKPLIKWFTELNRGDTRLAVAGQVRSGPEALACIEAGADIAAIGRAAIVNHDFPLLIRDDPDFAMPALPIAPGRLDGQGISPKFMDYLGSFPGFLIAA